LSCSSITTFPEQASSRTTWDCQNSIISNFETHTSSKQVGATCLKKKLLMTQPDHEDRLLRSSAKFIFPTVSPQSKLETALIKCFKTINDLLSPAGIESRTTRKPLTTHHKPTFRHLLQQGFLFLFILFLLSKNISENCRRVFFSFLFAFFFQRTSVKTCVEPRRRRTIAGTVRGTELHEGV